LAVCNNAKLMPTDNINCDHNIVITLVTIVNFSFAMVEVWWAGLPEMVIRPKFQPFPFPFKLNLRCCLRSDCQTQQHCSLMVDFRIRYFFVSIDSLAFVSFICLFLYLFVPFFVWFLLSFFVLFESLIVFFWNETYFCI
jgi:hypothetical protein